MTIESRLAEIRARAENAAEGPWNVHQYRQGGGRVSTPDGYPLPGCFNCGENDAIYEEGDAEFIAHARTDLPALLAAVETVLDLHAADEDGDCAECIRRAQGRGDQSYPCLTVTALTAALEAQG